MPESVLIDTNLAVLLAVGSADRSMIYRHKRLQHFDVEDFDLLQEMISLFSEIIFLPNVVSETSNLIRQIRGPDRVKVVAMLAELVSRAREIYVPSADAVRRSEYGYLGVTDAALLAHGNFDAGSKHVILTVDLDLYLACEAAGLATVNFNHVRERERGL